MIVVHFTSLGFGIWLAVVLALSALASVLPARNAASLTVREVLAWDEGRLHISSQGKRR
jgi:ABC-type lipoprotein release transport system permease subunit